MAIISGRNGSVLWDPTGGATAVEIISLNAWTADFKTEYEDVTCFGDVNRVYIPGMKDAGGTIGGFFNSEELAVFEAAEQDTPGTLKLLPSSTEPLVFWTGPAYMDASIDASLSAPKLSGSWKAAGPFLLEGAALSALAATNRKRRFGRGRDEPDVKQPAA